MAAIRGLQLSRQDIAAPFERLESARIAFARARSRLNREALLRDNAREMRDQLQSPIASARRARNQSIQNRMRVLNSLQQELRIEEEVGEAGVAFNIITAGFNITIDSVSPTQVPVSILYESPALQHTREVVVNFDLAAPQQINLRLITLVIVQDLFAMQPPRGRRSATRHRRQAESENQSDLLARSTNEMIFQDHCANLEVLVNFTEELRESLFEVRNRDAQTEARLEASIENLIEKLGAENRANISLEELQTFFNVSINDVVGLPEQESSDYRSYVESLIAIATETIQTINRSSFLTWQVSTTLLYDQLDSIAGEISNGFADSLEIVADVSRALVTDLPRSAQKDRLMEKIRRSTSNMLTLATSTNLDLQDATIIVSEFYSNLQDDAIGSYWCSSLPNITDSPPLRANVSLRSNLVLSCEAFSSLPSSVQWRKNGAPIPGAIDYMLMTEDVNMMDSGNYTCAISNAVGTSESSITMVTIYQLPEFFFVLNPVVSMLGNESGVNFACNASGYPSPGWRWYYRSNLRENWVEMGSSENMTNELIIPLPQFSDEGWYTCEAYNDYGSIRAEPVFLTVLPRTVSQLSIKVRFDVFPCDNNTRIGHEAESGSGRGSGASRGIGDLESDIDCSIDIIREVISEYLSRLTESSRASVESLDITYNSAENSVSIAFLVASENVTNDADIHNVSFDTIQNRALPSRQDVTVIKRSIVADLFSETTFMCNGYELAYEENSLNFDVLTYLCPAGQELNSDFLFCGKIISYFL